MRGLERSAAGAHMEADQIGAWQDTCGCCSKIDHPAAERDCRGLE